MKIEPIWHSFFWNLPKTPFVYTVVKWVFLLFPRSSLVIIVITGVGFYTFDVRGVLINLLVGGKRVTVAVVPMGNDQISIFWVLTTLRSLTHLKGNTLGFSSVSQSKFGLRSRCLHVLLSVRGYFKSLEGFHLLTGWVLHLHTVIIRAFHSIVHRHRLRNLLWALLSLHLNANLLIFIWTTRNRSTIFATILPLARVQLIITSAHGIRKRN